MIHITLAIGIVIGGILYSLAFKLFQPADMQTLDIIRLQQYSYASYIPALIISILVVKSISLKSRLPKKIPMLPILVIGVWMTLFKIVIGVSFTVKMGLGYLVNILPFTEILVFIIESSYLNTISSVLILISLFIIILKSTPNLPADSIR